ncbi:uncharacterized protein EV420DRAFT_1638531 [Desarmillaria tabescens]|uniref:Uncharacterized protein n=1 Tax=Armillaria tabescens TaxID=1929756 RepID=A0AA39TU58_ARMTA|nr:uncharacterized protein EV420DRAFT_1638531 [Desarmillaria tabescens]KAK0463604.1 hypothetical protein EV420DRAFT_1638531 [Desarmillaria tabescens]
MSHYTADPVVVQEYKNSQTRVLGWVTGTAGAEFYSPNAPPTELDEDERIPGSPVSDAWSSISVPPRLKLRFTDGRPDQPIPNPQRDAAKGRKSSTRHGGNHDGTKSFSGRSRHGQIEQLPSQSPEEIQILPSQYTADPVPTRPVSHQSRSRSLPRNTFSQTHTDAPPPPIPNPQVPFYPPSMASFHGPQVKFTQSQPVPSRHGSAIHHKRTPPAIVYAPSGPFHANYQPPVIYNYMPNVGPNGMLVENEVIIGTGSAPLRRTASFAASDESGSTYYVIPTGKQKVHVIRPGDTTVYGSSRSPPSSRSPTSTKSPASSKSPVSPMYPSPIQKKPFLQRLFSLAPRLSFSSASSGKGSTHTSRRLQRRHSTGTRSQRSNNTR